MALPTDGYAIFDNPASSLGSGTWGPRLDAIKAGGFSVVINFGLLYGHMTDVQAYINYANSIGLKVCVTINDPKIWRDNTYQAEFPVLYADSGNAATGTAFMQYIVANTKNLPGVYGWYIADEPNNVDHTTFKTYADAIKTADSTHPRVVLTFGHNPDGVSGTAMGTTLFADCCEIMGDDYYPYGQPQLQQYPYATTALMAAANQSFCTAHSVSSCFGLQAFSYINYGVVSIYCPWPSEADMQQDLAATLANMAPRLIIWYSYYDAVDRGNSPASQWSSLVTAIASPTNKKVGRFAVHL